MNFGTLSPSRAPRSLGAALWLAALAACGPRRPADFVGVVKGVGQGQFGWEAHVEADAGGPSYSAGEPMIVYLGRQPVGCRFSLDAGGKKSVRKGKGEITINGTDLLNTMQVKRTIHGMDFHHGEHGLPRDAGDPGGIPLAVLAGARRSEPGRQRFGES